MPEDRVPNKPLKVTCNKCQHRFSMDKSKWLNCRIIKPGQAEESSKTSAIEEDGWMVQHPACEGLKYKLEALGGLIRSGMINARTLILPPNASKYYEAKELQPLRKFFEQRLRMNKAYRDKTLH